MVCGTVFPLSSFRGGKKESPVHHGKFCGGEGRKKAKNVHSK
jgi:hypothetical protein